MGNDVSDTNTQVANASGASLRVYYSEEKIELDEVVDQPGDKADCSETGKEEDGSKKKTGTKTEKNSGSEKDVGSETDGPKMSFKPDSEIAYICVPPNNYNKISGEGSIYVCIFEESRSGSEAKCKKTISDNFYVPCDRSIIVTAEHEVKFQKHGQGLWVDQDGVKQEAEDIQKKNKKQQKNNTDEDKTKDKK